MRGSYNGITLAFQANDEGSIPLPRSSIKFLQIVFICSFNCSFLVVFSLYGTVAQSVEQRTFNPLVEGSNPSGPTSFLF